MFIEVKNLSKKYKSGDIEVKALSNATFEADRGEIVVILGPSGSGKSTLLNILGGIDTCSEGTVVIDNQDITTLNTKGLVDYRRSKVGFVFQFYNLIPHLTVKENIGVTEDISKNPLDVDQVLNSLGLLALKNRFPRELSGGQQQRVSLARAIIKNPKLVFCDEPTGALDMKSSQEVLERIEDLSARYKTTIFIITHNVAIASMAHRVITLRDGEIVENRINHERVLASEVVW